MAMIILLKTKITTKYIRKHLHLDKKQSNSNKKVIIYFSIFIHIITLDWGVFLFYFSQGILLNIKLRLFTLKNWVREFIFTGAHTTKIKRSHYKTFISCFNLFIACFSPVVLTPHKLSHFNSFQASSFFLTHFFFHETAKLNQIFWNIDINLNWNIIWD